MTSCKASVLDSWLSISLQSSAKVVTHSQTVFSRFCVVTIFRRHQSVQRYSGSLVKTKKMARKMVWLRETSAKGPRTMHQMLSHIETYYSGPLVEIFSAFNVLLPAVLN